MTIQLYKKGNSELAPALFFLPPLGGTCMCYKDLADALKYEGNIYFLDLPDGNLFSFVNEVEDFLKNIIQNTTTEEYIIAGWSLGTAFAHLITAMLEEKEKKATAFLIDPSP